MFGFTTIPNRPVPDHLLRLMAALDLNAKDGVPIKMDPRTTEFVGCGGVSLDEYDETMTVIDTIRAVPTHY